jgi:membrane-associated phospholipid phosphatase
MFFGDFCDIGGAIAEDPLRASVITGSVLLAGGLIYAFDRDISSVMKQKNGFNDAVFDVTNYFGDGLYVLAADSFLFLGGRREKKAAQLVIESVLVSGALNYAIKAAAGRGRPSETVDPYFFRPFNISNSWQSMPSGHSCTAFAWATVIGDTYEIGWLTYPLAGLTAWARVYKNAHWPSDTLLGGAIGVITAKILMAAREKESEEGGLEIRYSGAGTPLLGAYLNI